MKILKKVIKSMYLNEFSGTAFVRPLLLKQKCGFLSNFFHRWNIVIHTALKLIGRASLAQLIKIKLD